MSKTKLALKRLTASDLTFFEWHFKNENAGNQKAINLNRNVFVDLLYPALPDVAAEKEGRLPIDLTIFGPDGKVGLNLQRKIVKLGAYKNWRLNGEFVHNPETDPTRFNELRPNDLALFEFAGVVVPMSARVILLSEGGPKDGGLHEALSEMLGAGTMGALTQRQLADVIDAVNPDLQHPVRLLVVDAILEEAAQGGVDSLDKLWSGVARLKLTTEALQKARQNAEDIGKIGEEIVNACLEQSHKDGRVEQFEWVSADNAVAPFDFLVRESGTNVLIDVKATSGEFSRRLHVSMNELRQIANGVERYDLWRVYEINGAEAKVRIAKDIRSFGRSILSSLQALPEGITPDGFSVDPEKLPFEAELTILGQNEEPIE